VRLLFIADVIGAPGFAILKRLLPELRNELRPDIIVANGENGADGRGFTTALAMQYKQAGVDVVTGGNHIFDKRQFIEGISSVPWVLRPMNFPDGVSGEGVTFFPTSAGDKIAVISLQGRTYMSPIDCPFRTLEGRLSKLRKKTSLIFVDFHAEATAEKQALARYFDGQVSAVIGTHTHVQTADEKIFPNGTGYLTDAGMTGPMESIIGNAIEPAIQKFRMHIPVPQTIASGDCMLQGVLVEIDTPSGRCNSLQRINLK